MKQLLKVTLPILSLTVALFLGLSAVAFAQEITGSINGTVKDSVGAAVNGATVTITDSDKKVVVRTLSTNDDGEFSAPLLPVAFYDITVEAPNFKKHVESHLRPVAGEYSVCSGQQRDQRRSGPPAFFE